MGQRREPAKQKSTASAPAQNKATTEKLIQLLIKKGLITPEEGHALGQP
jgi:hypothetical protein